jgi:hypothetical protein
MKFSIAFALLAYQQAATTAFTTGTSSSPAFVATAKTTTHLSSAVAGSATDVYTFAKSEEIFAEAQEVMAMAVLRKVIFSPAYTCLVKVSRTSAIFVSHAFHVPFVV